MMTSLPVGVHDSGVSLQVAAGGPNEVAVLAGILLHLVYRVPMFTQA